VPPSPEPEPPVEPVEPEPTEPAVPGVNIEDYESLDEAIAAVPEGGTLVLTEGTVINDKLTLDKSMKIAANGATISAPLTVTDAEVQIDDANLEYQGSSNKVKTPVVKVTGASNFSLTNSTVTGTCRDGLLIKTSGEVIIEGNTFNAGNSSIYNMIEFGIGESEPDVTKLTIKNNTFSGTLGNNAISIYNVAEDAEITIEDNIFENIDPDNNPIRLSNVKNNSATFNIINNVYTFSSDTPTQYTGFILLQDYTKKSGAEQQFNLFTINVKDLYRGSTKIEAEGTGLDRLFYVYEDGTGILDAGVNDPVVNFV
jgi:hypothetical protein